jgi:GNAT superfamily N-acetyltransferase
MSGYQPRSSGKKETTLVDSTGRPVTAINEVLIEKPLLETGWYHPVVYGVPVSNRGFYMSLNPKYEIRSAIASDIERVSALANICAEGRIRAYGIQPGDPDYKLGVEYQRSEAGLEELRYQMRLAMSDSDAHQFWVAERRSDERLAALCIASMVRSGETPHVYMDRVFVAKGDEGNGIASEFVARLISWAGNLPITSEVVVGNNRALGLYEHLGFRAEGETEPTPGFETGLKRVYIIRWPTKKEVA